MPFGRPYESDYKVSNDESKLKNLLSLEQLRQQLKIYQEELLQSDRVFNGLDGQDFQLTSGQNLAWSFTQGLVIGQVSIILLLIIFIKFFVFAEGSSIQSSTSVKDASAVVVRKDKQLLNEESTNEDNSLDSNVSALSFILEKTYYDVDNHPPESLDWFNVLIAQMISQIRNEALLADNIYHSLNQFLEKSELPEYLGRIQITEIDVGDDFPIFSNCRIKHSSDGSGRLEAHIDVDLSDSLTLGIATRLLINYPRPQTAVLPVELSVTIVRISGCLSVSLINASDHEAASNDSKAYAEPKSSSETQEHTSTALMFSFAPDFRLEFTVKSLIGSRAKLQDVPKISSLIESKLRAWFIERCVEPRFQVIKLPSLWPRRKNTRESAGPSHNDPNLMEEVI